MASKRRVKRRVCGQKVRHQELKNALKAAERQSRSDKELTAYFCRYCGGFHVGHSMGIRNGYRRKAWFILGYYGG